MKINYVKVFVQLKINTPCLHISDQQTNKLRLRESLQTDAQSLRLRITSLNVLPTCLFSKTSLQTV